MFIRYDDYSESFDEDDEVNSEIKCKSPVEDYSFMGFDRIAGYLISKKKLVCSISLYLFI